MELNAKRAVPSPVFEAAVQFARMWGVMETLDDTGLLESLDFQAYVTAWAEEFAAAAGMELTAFFQRKLNLLQSRVIK